MASVGRNDPCPCGSGKKWKKCHALVRPSPAAPVEAPEHALDRDLVPKLFKFGKKRFGDGWNPFANFPSDLEMDEHTAQFIAPWAAYEARFDDNDKRLVDLYLEHERRITSAERAWLVAQQKSSLSLWEVVRVERDHGLHVVDLLTGDERFVRERLATRTIVNRDAVLARVVDVAEYSVFCGMYPRILHPELAAEVVRIVRGELGARARKKVSRERLREEESTDILIEVWEEAVDEMLRPKPVPKLANTDGDELLLTVDRYALEPNAREEVLRRLAALEGAVADDEAEDGEWTIDFQRPGNPMHKAMENTVVGVARVTDTVMKLETNSLRRADDLRRRVETACGWLVTHRMREHSDPQTILEKRRLEPKGTDPTPMPAEVEIEIVRDYKAKHYEGWLDTGVPALGNRTPREATGIPRLRAKLDIILKELENHESRRPEAERFDVAVLRAKLGMDAKSTGAAGLKRARRASSTTEL